MNKDNDLPLLEFKNFVNGPSNKNLFVLKENGKEYRAINDNNKSCVELQIDKGIIDNEEINKCDKGLIVLDDDKCILVELKGCDVSKACIQLNSTLDIFKKKLLKVNNYDYYCRAVVTSMPSPNNYPTSYKILLKNLNNCKNKLICKSKKLEEKI